MFLWTSKLRDQDEPHVWSCRGRFSGYWCGGETSLLYSSLVWGFCHSHARLKEYSLVSNVIWTAGEVNFHSFQQANANLKLAIIIGWMMVVNVTIVYQSIVVMVCRGPAAKCNFKIMKTYNVTPNMIWGRCPFCCYSCFLESGASLAMVTQIKPGKLDHVD